MGPVVWIEGIIGAGKSTLTKSVSEALSLRPIYEPVEDNEYLVPFYKDQKRWAWPMQVELMARRYGMQMLAMGEAMNGHGAILDRGMPGDRVFAKMHVRAGNIHEREWRTYERLYDQMTAFITSPRLLVFLDVDPSVAMERIKNRGREAEGGIDIGYLRDLRTGYLDLLVEIESGAHHWSRGMEVVKLPWNVDHQSPEVVVDEIRHRCRL
jgi:deoxyadenosine/deoxycytidine kinase